MRTSYSTWQPIYFGLFSITVVTSVIFAWLSNGCPQCANWRDVLVEGGADGAVYATMLVSLIEVIRIMIILPADYLSQKFVEPLKERQRKEGRAQGLAEGREEGRAEGREEGRAKLRAEIVDWLRRKEEHEREGKEFNEPMPGAESNGTKP